MLFRSRGIYIYPKAKGIDATGKKKLNGGRALDTEKKTA